MRRILLYTIATLFLGLPGVGFADNHPNASQDDKTVCKGDFGTAVRFAKSPSAAAKQALNEEKLVMVLHVSGDFEDPDFT